MLNLNRANLSLEPINTAINSALERIATPATERPREQYLGASILGHECLRRIQYEWWSGRNFRLKIARDLNAGIISKSGCASILLRLVSSSRRPQRVPSLRSGARCADMPTALSFTAPTYWAPM